MKLKEGDIVLWGYAKGGGLRRNIVVKVGRKYATIHDERLGWYTFRNVKVLISNLKKTTKPNPQ